MNLPTPTIIRRGDLTATLYCGDCLEIAPQLNGVKVVVADPPYGIDYQHSGCNGNTTASKIRGNAKLHGDNKPFDPMPWLDYENVILWGSDHFYKRLPDSGRFLAWNKLGEMEPWDSFSDVEFAWHSGEGAARIFSMKWKGIACDKAHEDNGLRVHTTQKPVRLMSWCLDQAKVKPLETVLDPFMGSGTTGVACLRTGRSFVGIEIDPKYFAIACERIDREARQGVLF